MSKIIFNYKSSSTTIQCNAQETMKDIYKKFESKINIDKEIDLSKLIFMYNGSKIDENSTYDEIINEEDRQSKQTIILVDDLNEGDTPSEIIIKSNEIICPTCNENAFIQLNDYKININGCKKGHNAFNILLNEFEETQGIDVTKITCENDNCNINKGGTFANVFYRCIICKKNLCPICKTKHNKENKDHKIIVSFDCRSSSFIISS